VVKETEQMLAKVMVFALCIDSNLLVFEKIVLGMQFVVCCI